MNFHPTDGLGVDFTEIIIQRSAPFTWLPLTAPFRISA